LRRIALEEAFWYDGLVTTNAPNGRLAPVRPDIRDRFGVRLTDFTEFRLPEMDQCGIDVQVLSLTQPGIQGQTDAAVAISDAERANDYLAETIAKYPTRFVGLAALPTQDPAAAASELRRAVTQLGFRGALVNDQTQGRYLDDAQYDVLWSELQSLNVPLYLHPSSPGTDDVWNVLNGYPELTGALFSWAAATAGHFLRLIYGGVFDRYPDVMVILGHMGEFLPFQLARLDARHEDQIRRIPLAKTPSEYIIDNAMITTSGVCSHPALLGAIGAVGIDNVMFAVDYPYESTARAVSFLDTAPLAEPDRARIAHTNAERLLRL
jgi:2,3-dihydroxybenzoate decarboxylase